MSERKSYRILVTETRRVSVVVSADSEERAKMHAVSAAVQQGFATTHFDHRVEASWPVLEREQTSAKLVKDVEVQRGWWMAGEIEERVGRKRPERDYYPEVRYRKLALTENQVFLDTTLTAQDGVGLEKRFTEYEPAFAGHGPVLRAYGFAAREPGTQVWSGPYETERKAITAARRERNRREQVKRDEAAVAAWQRRLLQLRHIMVETICFMQDSEGALTKAGLGRWTTTKKLGGRDYKTTLDGEWFVEREIVDMLLEKGFAKVFDQYEVSGDPRTIILTKQGWEQPDVIGL